MHVPFKISQNSNGDVLTFFQKPQGDIPWPHSPSTCLAAIKDFYMLVSTCHNHNQAFALSWWTIKAKMCEKGLVDSQDTCILMEDLTIICVSSLLVKHISLLTCKWYGKISCKWYGQIDESMMRLLWACPYKSFLLQFQHLLITTHTTLQPYAISLN